MAETAAPKAATYERLAAELSALLGTESDFVANAAQFSSFVFHALPDVNWAGFYFRRGGQLVLGPFHGKPACTRILLGKGVCGTSAQERQTIVVPDVRRQAYVFAKGILQDAGFAWRGAQPRVEKISVARAARTRHARGRRGLIRAHVSPCPLVHRPALYPRRAP